MWSLASLLAPQAVLPRLEESFPPTHVNCVDGVKSCLKFEKKEKTLTTALKQDVSGGVGATGKQKRHQKDSTDS